ncbi:MAG: glycosyltransferase family 2 protein [Candidatus Omnitrophota bacterium]
MKTIVIIPAYNEEARIGGVIRGIVGLDIGLDIVVVNDGSFDGTCGCAKTEGAAVLNHPINMGYGAALQTGYKYALENGYDIVVQMDGDGQHDPKYIPYMLDASSKEDVDVVIGSRFKQDSGYQAPVLRRLGMIFFGILVTLVTRRKTTDPTSGYQAIRRRVLPFLASEEFPCDYADADLLIMLYYNGFTTAEFPMQMYLNERGKSMHSGIPGNLYYVFKICLSIFLTVVRENLKRGRREKCL